MKHNEHCVNLGMSARLDNLRSHQSFWKNPTGSWETEPVGDWVHDLQNVRYYQNMWVRCRDEEDLNGAVRWSTIQCVCWESQPGGQVVSEMWYLSFAFSFEGFAADPGRNLLFLVDTRTVPGERSLRYVLSQTPICMLRGSQLRRLWTFTLSSGDPIDEMLFQLDNSPSAWSYYITDAMHDLVGVVTFESVLGDFHGGACRVTLVDVAGKKMLDVCDLPHIPLEFTLSLPSLRACTGRACVWTAALVSKF